MKQAKVIKFQILRFILMMKCFVLKLNNETWDFKLRYIYIWNSKFDTPFKQFFQKLPFQQPATWFEKLITHAARSVKN